MAMARFLLLMVLVGFFLIIFKILGPLGLGITMMVLGGAGVYHTYK